MFVPLRNLVDRASQPRSRAADLRALRARFVAERRRGVPSTEERALAARLRHLRARVAAAFGDVSACRGCAAHLPPPEGAFAGGHCCCGPTAHRFSDVEIATLSQAGTRVTHLTAPRTEHAGCAFRGATSCTLAAVDRPNVCVAYMCRDLQHELFDAGRLDAIEALVNELDDCFTRFIAARDARLLDDELAAIHPALAQR